MNQEKTILALKASPDKDIFLLNRLVNSLDPTELMNAPDIYLLGTITGHLNGLMRIIDCSRPDHNMITNEDYRRYINDIDYLLTADLIGS